MSFGSVRFETGHILASKCDATRSWTHRAPQDLGSYLSRMMHDQPAMTRLRLMCSDHQPSMSFLPDNDILDFVRTLVERGQLAFLHEDDVAGRISEADLVRAFPTADPAYLKAIATDLNSNLAAFGLETVLEKAHFFAQLREECGPGLDKASESLNYPPDRLKATFRYYRDHPAEADVDGRTHDRKADQNTIANKVYASRNGNGGLASGDGWKYRGRGLIQVTGRENYKNISQQYSLIYARGDVDLLGDPDSMSRFPFTLRSAVCFWTMHSLPKIADRGSTDETVDAVTRVINKHTGSFDARRKHFQRLIKIFRKNP